MACPVWSGRYRVNHPFAAAPNRLICIGWIYMSLMKQALSLQLRKSSSVAASFPNVRTTLQEDRPNNTVPASNTTIIFSVSIRLTTRQLVKRAKTTSDNTRKSLNALRARSQAQARRGLLAPGCQVSSSQMIRGWLELQPAMLRKKMPKEK